MTNRAITFIDFFVGVLSLLCLLDIDIECLTKRNRYFSIFACIGHSERFCMICFEFRKMNRFLVVYVFALLSFSIIWESVNVWLYSQPDSVFTKMWYIPEICRTFRFLPFQKQASYSSQLNYS